MQTLTLRNTIARDFTLVALACFAICLSGQIAIPLWFTPVPLVTQNAMVLLMAVLLGSRRGLAATVAFLAQGALGLPVFTKGGAGLLYMCGPSGGYLIGYLIAAFVVGLIAEKRKTIGNAFFALSVGHLIIYACGMSYLATFTGFSKAFLLGVAPFLLGDAMKTVASLKILQWTGWNK